MKKAHVSSRPVLATALLALVVLPAGVVPSAQAEHKQGQRIGLKGHCPVCVIEARKWEKGSPDHQATFDGVTYYFPNDTLKQKFLASPAKYVPALGGDCVVCYAKLGKRVAGSIDHTARYGNRLFLFPSDKEQAVFLKQPEKFDKVDLALNGDCAVCLVHANKRVPGKAEFTEVYHGFRYQFPSEKEQAAFRKDPARYAAAASKTKGASGPKKDRPTALATLTVTGKTACAGCEHGVTPIQNPEELGLAVNLPDGKVVVVEKAHKLYSDVYKNRFKGQKVRVSGRVLKQQGQITWIEPTALTVVK
jgi:YHS domain-containing protein